jgi:transposase
MIQGYETDRHGEQRCGRARALLIPEAAPGGRPRKTDMRPAINAIFYAVRRLPWHYLPCDNFPPRSMVCNIFRNIQRAQPMDGRAQLVLVRTKPASRQGFREP